MNRKLHNSVTALFATTGLLVLSLMAANPVQTAPDAVFAPIVAQPAQPMKTAKLVVDARHAAEAAARIEARAAGLQARIDAAKHPSDAVGEIVGFVAEAATLATIAAAMDGMEAGTVAADDVGTAAPAAPPARKRTHGRQSVSMPFYSFAPRG